MPSLSKKWRVGQGVKTPPFHGGITGSNPVRATTQPEMQYNKAFRVFYLRQGSTNSSLKILILRLESSKNSIPLNYLCAMLSISNRGKIMPASPIRKLVPFAEAAKKKGIKIYHLNIGQPDIETPPEILDAVRNSDFKILEYSHSAGNESYQE